MLRIPHVIVALIAMTVCSATVLATEPQDTVVDAEQVLHQLMEIPAKQIPHQLLEKAHGIVIVPNVIKIGFIAGARRGLGVVLVRDADGEWTLPQFVTLTGGSVGWQAGIQGTDVVLVFTSQRGIDGLLRGKFTIGVDAAATAGPVGREAAIGTDATLESEIYSYSRSRGLFVGVSLDGSAVEIDHEAHNYFYGTPTGELPRRVPASASHLRQILTELAPRKGDIQPVDQPQAPRNVPETSPRRLDAIRRSLFDNSQRLQTILSAEWKVYLEIPDDVIRPGANFNPETLRSTIQRFQHVNNSTAYGQLTERAEFQNTYALLREYEKAVMSQRSGLQLPPPPQNR